MGSPMGSTDELCELAQSFFPQGNTDLDLLCISSTCSNPSSNDWPHIGSASSSSDDVHMALQNLIKEAVSHLESETGGGHKILDVDPVTRVESERALAPSYMSLLPIYEEEVGEEIMQDEKKTFTVKLSVDGPTVPLAHETVNAALEEIAVTMLGSTECRKAGGKARGFGVRGTSFADELLSLLPRSLLKLQERGKMDIGQALQQLESGNDITDKLGELFFPLCLKLKKTDGEPILPQLLRSNLQDGLSRILKETDSFEVTLGEVKNEASRLLYFHLQRQDKKVLTHPKHIKDIPRDWAVEHPANPPDPVKECIANYTGLDMTQVRNLFQNFLKRKGSKYPELASRSRKRLKPAAIEKLREWKTQHPEKKNPDKASMQILMEVTELKEDQIRNWFYNNAPGRENRNKSRAGSRDQPGDQTRRDGKARREKLVPRRRRYILKEKVLPRKPARKLYMAKF